VGVRWAQARAARRRPKGFANALGERFTMESRTYLREGARARGGKTLRPFIPIQPSVPEPSSPRSYASLYLIGTTKELVSCILENQFARGCTNGKSHGGVNFGGIRCQSRWSCFCQYKRTRETFLPPRRAAHANLKIGDTHSSQRTVI